MKKMIFLVIAGFVFLGLSLAMAADIPMMLNYQGYVEYEDGIPFNGNGFFKFAIVDPNGNTTYWSNDGTSTIGNEPDNEVKIPVTNGVFTLKLGNTDMTNMHILPTTVFDQQNIYVRVWFSDDNITFEQLVPDTQIVSAGFAYKAQSVVDSAVTSTIIQDGTITNADLSSTANIDASKIDTLGLDVDMMDGSHLSDIEDRIIGEIAEHSSITNVHHTKTTSFTELTDIATDAQIPDDITINYAAEAGDAKSLAGAILGTPDGIATLDPNGTIPSDQLPGITVDSKGNVGIGITNPSERLDIDGRLKATVIESTEGGVQFPDGTIQTTASFPTWSQKLPADERFELVLDDEGVLDRETGLVWERAPDAEGRTWGLACKHCFTRCVGGRMGWRLPTIEELTSLMDMTILPPIPALPIGDIFKNVKSDPLDYYWSSTTYTDDTNMAYVTNFWIHSVGYSNKSTSTDRYVLCVRGGHGHDAY